MNEMGRESRRWNGMEWNGMEWRERDEGGNVLFGLI
jgi:hypothetical protein